MLSVRSIKLRKIKDFISPAGLLVTIFLYFLLWRAIISFLLLKNNFTVYRILGCCFFPQHFKYLILLSSCIVSQKESNVILILFLSRHGWFFLFVCVTFGFFQDFLCPWLSALWIYMPRYSFFVCLFLVFIIFEILWVSWICGFVGH